MTTFKVLCVSNQSFDYALRSFNSLAFVLDRNCAWHYSVSIFWHGFLAACQAALAQTIGWLEKLPAQDIKESS